MSPTRSVSLVSSFAALAAGACVADPDATAEATVAAVSGETALCFPKTGRKLPVDKPSDLAGVLASARQGDHVVLAGGTYNQDASFDGNGTASAPIVIEPAPGARVTLRGTLTLGGSFAVVTGLAFATSGTILLTGHHIRITRNTFTGQNVGDGGIIDTDRDAIAFNRVDHNEFTSFKGAAYHSDGFGASDNNQGIRIDHNYFAHHTVGPKNESVALMLTDAYTSSHLQYDHNLFDDVLNGQRSEREVVSIKTGGTLFLANTVMRSPGVRVSLRTTNGSTAQDNVLLDGAGMKVAGNDNTITGNRVADGGAIEIEAGDHTMADRPKACMKNAPTTPFPACDGVHTNAIRTDVINNLGRIVIGDHFDGDDIAAQGTTLRNNEQEAIRVAHHETGTSESGIGRATASPRALTRDDVGIGAGDPSCD